MTRQSLLRTLSLIASDFRFRAEFERKHPGPLTYLRFCAHPAVFSITMVRLQRFFDTHWLRPLGWLLEMTNLLLFSVKVDSRAEIGPCLLMLHPSIVFIDGSVRIGSRCVLYHQNAIGLSPFLDPRNQGGSGGVVIGDDVWFGAGACAYGDITIGDGCRIGVNTVVESSFPAGSTLFGVPARIVARTQGGEDA